MTRYAFDAAKAEFDEVAAAVAAFEGEGVIFDALASYEQDRAELLLATPAPTLADVLVKLQAWRSIEAGDTREIIELLAADGPPCTCATSPTCATPLRTRRRRSGTRRTRR